MISNITDYIKKHFATLFSHFVAFLVGILTGGFFLSGLFK